jgi:hypothetical protein
MIVLKCVSCRASRTRPSLYERLLSNTESMSFYGSSNADLGCMCGSQEVE